MNAVAELYRAVADAGSGLPRSVRELPADGEDAVEAKRVLARLLRVATVFPRFSQADAFRFENVDRLYGEAVRADCPEYLLEALNYLRLYGTIAARLRGLRSRDELWLSTRLPREAAGGLIAAVKGARGFDPGLLSSDLVLAKLHALRSRSDAFRYFAAVSARLSADRELFGHEEGVDTYFDRAKLEREAEAIAGRRASLPARHEHGPIDLNGTRYLCLISCEQTFLRVYLPYWLSVAEYLGRQGFAYHVLVVASAEEAAAIVEEAEAVGRAMAKLRGADPADFCHNVSFSSVGLPAGCGDERSYSACARYLYARDLCEQTGIRVIVQDIDLVVSHDPTAWFEAMPRERIVLDSNSPDVSLDPWRKFPAGLFGLPHDESAFELMRIVEDYLLAALGLKGSWYLDQNALSYLHDTVTREGEVAPDLLVSLDDPKAGGRPLPGGRRPIHGLPVHALFER